MHILKKRYKQEARYNALVKEYDKALEEIDNLKVMMKPWNI